MLHYAQQICLPLAAEQVLISGFLKHFSRKQFLGAVRVSQSRKV